MRILILGLNYAPEKIGIAVYTAGLAEMLESEGHDVEVVAGQPFYPAWTIPDGYRKLTYFRNVENGVSVTRCPHYVPARPTGLRRILHHLSFAGSAIPQMLHGVLVFKPDIVIAIAPSLIAAPIAWMAARICGAKSWLHVQDFEVDMAFAVGLLRKNGLAIRLALGFERAVLRLFDIVSSISPQMCRKLIGKGVLQERVVEFRNWTDIDAIKPLSEPSLYRGEWNITTPHVALYSGNIANKQGIEIVVEAARLLKERDDLTFVVCGEGPYRKSLEELAAGLTNIQFRDLQPKARLNELMSLATMHLLPQKADAADLVLPSKLSNMLASGRPVVATAAPGTGLAEEVEGCGLVTPPGDSEAFAAGIVVLADNPSLRTAFAAAGRKRAESRWSTAAALQKLRENLSSVSSLMAQGEAKISGSGR